MKLDAVAGVGGLSLAGTKTNPRLPTAFDTLRSMVECKYCGVEFHPVHRRNIICTSKDCRSAAQRERYAKWKAAHPGAETVSSRERRARNGYTPWPAQRTTALEVAMYKEDNPCVDCGNFFPQECMDFDHRDWSSKSNNVGTMVAHGHNRDKIWDEIAKCDLVCSNCHRTRTRRTRLRMGRQILAPSRSDEST